LSVSSLECFEITYEKRGGKEKSKRRKYKKAEAPQDAALRRRGPDPPRFDGEFVR